MSLDRVYLIRKVPTILDLFSELGGLFTSISRLFLLIISILNYFGSYQFLMAQMFYSKSNIGGKDDPFKDNIMERIDMRNDVQWNSRRTLMLNMKTFLPKSCLCCCCRHDKKSRRKSKAFRHILHETSITHIITQLRVLNAAARR